MPQLLRLVYLVLKAEAKVVKLTIAIQQTQQVKPKVNQPLYAPNYNLGRRVDDLTSFAKRTAFLGLFNLIS